MTTSLDQEISLEAITVTEIVGTVPLKQKQSYHATEFVSLAHIVGRNKSSGAISDVYYPFVHTEGEEYRFYERIQGQDVTIRGVESVRPGTPFDVSAQLQAVGDKGTLFANTRVRYTP